jgi:cysteinyl-tRNA synthetase
MRLYNSLTRQKEEFIPVKDKQVGLYTCGMTVYDYAHIGHGRKYVNDDVLRRTLQYLGYQVKHVQNVTDVGHLVSDEDQGEDKLEKGARKHGKTVWEVAEYFTRDFYKSMDKLNILRPHIICRATEHIPDQIQIIKKLVDRGLAYETEEAVYFDVTMFPNYGQMFGQKLEDKKQAVRKEVMQGEHKKNSADFTLWFKRVHRFADHVMHWDSPWGDGFPGWHLECSAMSLKYLGNAFDDHGHLQLSQTQTIDIHTGGIEHLPIHHPNEIAQSEGATGHNPFVNYWLHSNHLLVDGKKMSKSLGNFYRVQDIEKSLGRSRFKAQSVNQMFRNDSKTHENSSKPMFNNRALNIPKFDPLALRYFYFSAHYRRELNFTWEGIAGAQTALEKLRKFMSKVKGQMSNVQRSQLSVEKLGKVTKWQEQFTARISDDLDMPGALATVWDMLKDNIPDYDKVDLLLDWDQVLGLKLPEVESVSDIEVGQKPEVSPVVKELVEQRKIARARKDWDTADRLRQQIETLGFTFEDTPHGSKVKLISS